MGLGGFGGVGSKGPPTLRGLRFNNALLARFPIPAGMLITLWGFASAGLTHRLATVPLQACTMSRPAVHCCMTSAEGSLFDAVPQPTNDVLSDDVPAKSGDGSGEGSLSADELQGLTVPLLKGRLKARGLRVGGLKAELVARLLDAPAEPSPAALDADANADADAELRASKKKELEAGIFFMLISGP